jgi:hypothetical protein
MERHGTFFWNELNTGDVEAAKSFFAKTIGWTFEKTPNPQGDYWVASINGIPQAGIVPLSMFAPPGAPPHWFAYLAVDDVDHRIKELTASGGIILRPPFDIPNVGRIAIIQDPTGAVMGWMTPIARD